MAATSPSHLLISLTALLLLAVTPLTTAQAQRNISLDSSLTPQGHTTAWLSPSGDFAFGFQPLESDPTLFLLAIWFDKTVNKTVVWYANGNNPVQSGSRVDLTADGQLSLKNHTGQEVWNAGFNGASYAAMLDTGNFVLSKANGAPLWQSFGAPADTLLPSQVISLNTQLQSRLMDTDYSDGRFKLSMQLDGNLVLYLQAVATRYQYGAYWASNTVGQGTQLVFNESGSIYLTLQDETMLKIASTGDTSMTDFYHRATLDPDGVFRIYVCSKNGGSWMAMDGVPSSICQAFTQGTGGGACGFNSYCQSGDVYQRTDCLCPPQYSFLDPSRKYKGCKPDFVAQSCASDGSDFDFQEMINVYWPLSDYEHLNPMTGDQCKQNCLSDCSCAVAIYNNNLDCWNKKLPLSNGRMGSYVQATKVLIKISKGNNSWPQPPNPTREKKDRKTWKLVGSVLLGSSAFLNFLLIAVILMVVFGSYGIKTKKLHSAPSASRLNLRAFTYEELEQATNGFSEEIGRGAFGIVFKGLLESDRGTFVAVKKLDKLFQEGDKEFSNEVRSIGQTHHRNLVKLLGFCEEGSERLLVYEFMSNGSLTAYLLGSTRPDWNQRTQIVLGIARGLVYLHEECSTQIIHCDIKPQNILLDGNFDAKISDFGLAKLIRTDQTRTNTGIRGTKGYVAPEWFKNVGITAKVDVYSFGVMLLEIICCRKNVEKEAVNEEEIILIFWAYDCYREGRLDLLVENDEEARLDMKRVESFVKVAIWCIQEDPWIRPSMQKVIQMLEGTVRIPVPPDPSGNVSSFQ